MAVGAQKALHVRCGALRAGRVDGSCGLLVRREPRRKACGERGGRRVGTLPMRTVSRQGEAQQDEVANSYIFNIYYTTPGDERPQLAGTFCGILYHTDYKKLNTNKSISYVNSLLLFHRYRVTDGTPSLHQQRNSAGMYDFQ